MKGARRSFNDRFQMMMVVLEYLILSLHRPWWIKFDNVSWLSDRGIIVTNLLPLEEYKFNLGQLFTIIIIHPLIGIGWGGCGRQNREKIGHLCTHESRINSVYLCATCPSCFGKWQLVWFLVAGYYTSNVHLIISYCSFRAACWLCLSIWRSLASLQEISSGEYNNKPQILTDGLITISRLQPPVSSRSSSQ